MARWYVVETKPSCERLAVEHLRRQAFDVLFLTVLRRRIVRGRPVDFEQPLFARYLFIQIDTARDSWGSINGTLGVKRILCDSDGDPFPLPYAVADELVSRGAGGPLSEVEGQHLIKIGTKLSIEAGPLAGWLGRCEASGNDRVRVLLRMFGRPTVVDLPISAVSMA